MDIWIFNERGEKEFTGGKNDWNQAAVAAKSCSNFVLDDEDELTAEEPRSCYNCRYRRWSALSFVCLKP